MAKRQQPERKIKKVILDYLKARGHFVWENRNQGFPLAGGGFIPSPVRGVPDILGIASEKILKRKGVFVGVEVKDQYRKPSQDQIEFLKHINVMGGIGIVAYSIEDCIKAGL